MMLADFIGKLEGVQSTTRGVMAKCPAHDDGSPSLSVAEHDGKILLHCFAGCALDDICAALGLSPRDLFADAPTTRGQRQTPRPARVNRGKLAFRFELAALDLKLRAERIVNAGKNLHVAALADAELDQALGHVAQAYADSERAELFEGVADTLREREYAERKKSGAQSPRTCPA
jgi:hypothetical protein